MPRKKNIMPANQKRLISTRLMQISLLVDDYLYQQKPMSERSAVSYINEIATYKDKCYQDARSLQVIDKLTRCITAIIQEQQELHSAGELDINVPQYKIKETNVIPVPYEAPENNNSLMLSPVYSEIDEDLTQIPQYFEVENFAGLTASQIANDLYNNNDYNDQIDQVDVVPLGIKEIETDLTINVQKNAAGISLSMDSDSEVINLCDEDIGELIENHASFRHEPEFSIQKAISNLSIRDVNETFTPFSQQCSQSILDSLKAQKITYEPQDAMVPPKNFNNVAKPTAILQKPAIEMVSFRDGPTKIILPTTKQKVNVQDNLDKPVKKYTKKIKKKETVCTKTTATKQQKQTKRNYTKAVNKCEIIAKNGIERITKNRKTKATNKKRQENKDLSIKEKPLPEVVYKNIYKTSMQSHQKDMNIKTPTYQNIQTKASTNTNIISHDISENAVAPIQNKIKTTYVQNLSWVENLRFVRVIQVEEFEPFTDEGFWENYDLPAKFTEDDFNC